MGKIKRHMQVDSTRIADGALDTVDIKDASITAAKFSELQEYGTVAAVTATGTYITFDTAFGGTPSLVVTGIDAAARLACAPTSGSAKIELGAAGTAVVHYIAWGAR